MRVSLLSQFMAATIIRVRFESSGHTVATSTHVWVCVPLNGKATVWVELFRYYPDELYFEAGDFIGRTCEQALDYRLLKDIEYLQR